MEAIFFTFQSTIQLYHWNTFSHSRHEAVGDLYEAMSELIDRFMEVYIGHFKRSDSKKDIRLTIRHLSHKTAAAYLRSFAAFLNKMTDLPSDLLNIRDEMSAEIHRTLYRFTQK